MIKKVTLIILLLISFDSNSQTEIKINLASALALIPNIGLEVQLNEKFGYQLDTSASFWDSIDNNPFQFVQIFNELRYYPKKYNRSLFLGFHVGYGMFNIKNPKLLTSIVDTQFKPDGSYQIGRNTYYGLTIGKKIKLKHEKLNLEFFLGGGSSQSNYQYYNEKGNRIFGNINNERDFNKSGEELIYRGGLMLTFKL